MDGIAFMVLGGSGFQWLLSIFLKLSMCEHVGVFKWKALAQSNSWEKNLPSEQMCIYVKVLSFKIFGICIYDTMLNRKK